MHRQVFAKSLVFPVLILALFSFVKDDIPTIDLTDALRNPKEHYLSEIARDISLIRLETRPECLIGKVRSVFFADQTLIVLDQNDQQDGDPGKIFVFNTGGKFLNQIGKQGGGPGEYTHINSLAVDPVGKFVFILSSNGFINQHDFSGRLVKSTKLPFTVFHISIFHGKLLFHFNEFTWTGNQNCLFALSDFKVTSFERFLGSGSFATGGLGHKFFPYEDIHVFWTRMTRDTAYSVDKNFHLTPRFYLEYPDKLTREEMKNPLNMPLDKTFLSNMSETRNYQFFSVVYRRSYTPVFYEKRTGVSGSLKNYTGFFNDLNGGMRFYPHGKVDEDRVYSFFDMVSFREYWAKKRKNAPTDKSGDQTIKFLKKSQELETLYQNSDDSDNPVVVLVRLK